MTLLSQRLQAFLMGGWVVLASLASAQDVPPSATPLATPVSTQADADEATSTPILGQPCMSLDPNGTTLDILGFGGALFGDFTFNSREDRAELFNRICLQGEAGWQLESLRLVVESLSESPSFEASTGRLSLEDWTLAADAIRSQEGGLELDNARFYNATTQGSAEYVSYDIDSGEAVLQELAAVAGDYRIEGAVGRLVGNSLLVEDALATTCVCEDETLYVILAPEIEANLLSQVVRVRDGVLSIGSTEIRLKPELVLDEASFANLESPITVRYDGREEDGSGLGMSTRFGLAEGIVLELGVVGLDAEHDTKPFGIVKVSDPRLTATVGYNQGGGFQADIGYRQPLNDWLTFDFGVNNRYFASQNHLAEGYMGLSSRQTIALVEDSSLILHPRIFAAVSRQYSGGVIASPRLGAVLNGKLTSTTPAGILGLGFDAQATTYPAYWDDEAASEDDPSRAIQYGLYLNPSWLLRLEALTVSLSYQHRWTNEASPFTSKLDKLSELSKLNGSIRYAYGDVASFEEVSYAERARLDDRFGFGMSVAGIYDFLIDPEEANRWRSLNFGITSVWRYQQVILTSALELETAALWSEVYDAEVEARIEGDVIASLANGMRFGLRTRYYLEAVQVDGVEQPLLDVLELNAMVPFSVGRFSFEPYLGINVAPLLTDTGGLEFSSHGLTVAWESCCGTVSLGYLYEDEVVSTTIGLSIESGQRPLFRPEDVDPFGLEPVTNPVEEVLTPSNP